MLPVIKLLNGALTNIEYGVEIVWIPMQLACKADCSDTSK